MGGAWFEQRSLPCAGGAGEQPARLMQGLVVAARVANEVLQEMLKAKKRDRDRRARDSARASS
jgi:hypothetical protein